MESNKSTISIQQGSKSFYFATRFISEPLRSKLSYLYSICREIDDIGDTAHLTDISQEVLSSRLTDRINQDEVILFFQSNHIPHTLIEALVRGVLQDQEKNRYQNFEELYEYCYLVAGTVGRMITHLFGIHDETALIKAEILGVAMQLTNILRDIEEDLERDLIFLPQNDLKRFGVTEDDITNRCYSDSLKNLIAYYVEKNEQLYLEGAQGIDFLPPNTRLSIRISWFVYSGILEKIKENNFNPFKGRVYLTNWEKVFRTIKMIAQQK